MKDFWSDITQHRGELVAYLLRLGRKARNDASDLLHDLAVALAEEGYPYASVPNKRAFLKQRLRWLLLDLVRSPRYTRRRRVENIESIPNNEYSSRAPSGPERTIVQRETLEAVRRLPRHLREPLLLKLMEGLEVEKIASRLGCKIQTVHNRITLGTLALRRELGLVTVKGLVTTGSGEPIARARVIFRGKKIAKTADVTTGAKGNFRCEALPIGMYMVTCKANSFTSVEKQIEVYERMKRLHVVLEELEGGSQPAESEATVP